MIDAATKRPPPTPRFANSYCPLDAEIYARLADRPDLPHADRIAARAADLAAANP